MQLFDKAKSLYRKYGASAKFAAKVVLGAVVPGSPAVVELVGAVLDWAHDSVQEAPPPAASADDLKRVEEMIDVLGGDLQTLLAQVSALEGMPDVAQQVLNATLATDDRCRAAVAKLDGLARQFDRLEQQNGRILQQQGYAAGLLEEMLPLMRRAAGVADYLDELRAAGLGPAEVRGLLEGYQRGAGALAAGRVGEAQQALQEVARAGPAGSAASAALAAAQVAAMDLPAAEQSIERAARLRPDDTDLGDLARRVTHATRAGRAAAPPATAPAAPARSAATVGDELDGWRLEQLLGRGGWGQVFRATRDGREAALKVLHAELSRDPAFVERFKREIMALVRLGGQPHLVEIHTFGYAAERGCWYFVMAFVPGLSLEQHLTKHGPLDLAAARRVFAAVARGLAAAHAQGIVHRDIKPANILLAAAAEGDPTPTLIDFGVAAVATGSAHATGVGGYTAMFAAPEQLRMRPADARTDVYSLAGSLYYAVAFGDPKRREPDLFDPALVPEDLRDLLTQALHPNPDRRPPDAAAFLAQLEATGRRALDAALAECEGLAAAGRYDEAWKAFADGGESELYQRGESDRAVELLSRLFPNGLSRLPALTAPADQSRALLLLAGNALTAGRDLPVEAALRLKVAIDTRDRRAGEALLGRVWLCDAAQRRGALAEAETEGRRALAVARAVANQFQECGALGQLSSLALTRGDLAEAEACARRVQVLAADRTSASAWHIVDGPATFGEAALARGDLDAAARFAAEAEALARPTGIEPLVRRVELLQARIAERRGTFADAERILTGLLAPARAEGSLIQRFEAAALLAEVRRRKGDRAAARTALRGVLADPRLPRYPVANADVLAVQARLDLDDKRTLPAAEAAVAAFRAAWCDGPPFAYHDGLVKARELLKAVGRPEPTNLKPISAGPRDIPNVPIEPPAGPAPPCPWWPAANPPGISTTKGWTADQLQAALATVKSAIAWEQSTGSARKWWDAFEKENQHRLALVLRLAEELRNRKATVTEFFLAYVYSNTDNILANLSYLDFTRLAKAESAALAQAAAASPEFQKLFTIEAIGPAHPGGRRRFAGSAAYHAALIRLPNRPDPAARLLTASPADEAGLTDVTGLTDDVLDDLTRAAESRLRIESAADLARAWWQVTRLEHRDRPDVPRRLAELLAARGDTLHQLYESALYWSGTRDLLALIRYLSYARLRAAEDEKKGKRWSPATPGQRAALTSLEGLAVSKLRAEVAARAERLQEALPAGSAERQAAAEALTLVRALPPEPAQPRCSACQTLLPADQTACPVCRARAFEPVLAAALDDWTAALGNFHGEINPDLMRQATVELAGTFHAAVRAGVPFDCAAIATRISKAGKYLTSDKTIATWILWSLPPPRELDRKQKAVLDQVIAKADKDMPQEKTSFRAQMEARWK